MTGVTSNSAIRAEAAAWLARLCSDERTAADDAGFRAWLSEDPRHREAFDLVNTAWETAGGALTGLKEAMSAPLTDPRPRRASIRGSRPNRAVVVAGAAAMAATVMLVVGVGVLSSRPETFATGLGEQRRIALADGSTMLLDTSTTTEVRMRASRREIRLVRGRAHFDVARDKSRPFVVAMGKRRVVAVGTAFDTTLEGEVASVLLTHGKVRLEDAARSWTMEPRDRLVFRGATVVADKPDLDSLTAWQTGRAVFENEPLTAVVAELNRYSRRHLVIADPSVGGLRLSGSYKVGDVEAFAMSVSALLPVTARLGRDQITFVSRPVTLTPSVADVAASAKIY